MMQEPALGLCLSIAHSDPPRYLLPDAADFPRCWPVLREAFGETRPAATMMAVGLADPRMKIEIEVTARRRAAGPGADSG